MPVLLKEERDGVLILTLNRPDVRNALSGELATKLAESLAETASRRDIRVIIITGSGEKAFSAGTDLKERRDFTAEQKWQQRNKGWRVNQLLWHQPQPVLAAIQGWCIGGGFELALFCDLRLASKEAIFGFSELTLGSMPGAGGTILLPRLVGAASAKDLFFTGRRINADEALGMGLVQYIFSKDELMDKALDLAEQIKGAAPLSIAAVKKVVNLGGELGFEGASALAEALHRPLGATRDAEEGLKAFFEKRKAIFRGE